MFRVECQRLLQLSENADEIDNKPARLFEFSFPFVWAIHARDRLQQHVIAHRLIQIHAVENFRVIACQQLVRDNEDLRILRRFRERFAMFRLVRVAELVFCD